MLWSLTPALCMAQVPGVPAGPASPPGELRALISREQVEAKLRYLASDALAGRDTGSVGSLAAASWMADLLAAAGLQPAGDGEAGERGFLQDIERDTIELGAAPSMSWAGSGEALEQGADYELLDVAERAGGLRVHVVASREDLPETPSLEVALVLDGSARERREWLAAAGTPDSRGWGAVLRRGRGTRREARPNMRLGATATGERVDLRVHGEAWKALAAGEVERLVLEIETPTRRQAFNVIGLIEGVGTAQEPELAREVVVLTAHYDHLGTRARRGAGEPDEDRIYNGADDDASGTVTVLEIAEALAAGDPPARTVVVLLVTGEERGLLGTRFFIEHPVRPLSDVVCNLNFEMLGRPDALVGGPGHLWLTGDERSSLGGAMRAAGLPVEPDQRPQEQFFMRSDNFAFAQLGIVAQTLSSYDLHEEYHTPADDADSIDYDHLRDGARVGLAATLLLTSGELQPVWLPGGDPSRR